MIQIEGTALYSLEEVAYKLGLSVRTVRQYVVEGKAKAIKLGKWYLTDEGLSTLSDSGIKGRNRNRIDKATLNDMVQNVQNKGNPAI